MVVSKIDWTFTMKIIIKNNLEKNIPKHTPVLMVRNLSQYVIKHAKSEYNELDLTMNSLLVHFDADARAGRFVAFFAFMNTLHGKVVQYPFLIY